MNGSPRAPRLGVPGPTVRFVLVSIVAVCFTFPPETRGESAAGCAVLVLLLALLTAREVDLGAASALCLALAVAWPLAFVSLAPGMALQPLATLLLAATVGVCAASRAPDLRASAALPAALAAVAALASLHALYQILHGLDAAARSVAAATSLPDRDLILARLHAGRAFGSFATPAALGGLFAITLPVTVALASGCSAGKRALLSLAAVLQTVALAATASASAAGALLAATIVWFVRRGGRARTLVLAAGGLGVVLAGIVALRGSSVIDPTAAQSPWRLRAGNVRAAAAMAADHPWTGIGPGAFGEAYPLYRRPGDNEARHAHDLPVELLAEYGVPLGALASALFFWLFLGPVLAQFRPGPVWIEGLRIGLAAFAIHNLVDFTAAFPSFLLAAAVLRAACAGAGSAQRAGGWSSLPRLAPIATAALAGSIVALSGLAWNARVAARTESAPAGDSTSADLLTRRSVRLAPWDPDARMLRAELLLRPEPSTAGDGARLEAALVEAEAAVRLTPLRAAARALRARIRLALGDVPGAFADLHEAARLYPMREEYRRDRDALAARLPDSSRTPGGR